MLKASTEFRDVTCRLITLILCLIVFPIGVCSQSSATITLDRAEVTAGDPITLILNFDQPVPCAAGIYLQMKEDSESSYLILRGNIEAGKSAATLSLTIPKDKKGVFRIDNSQLLPCEGYSEAKLFSASPTVLHVQGLPDLNKYPSKAGVVLSLTQRQFLETKIAELKDLSSQIDTRVDQSASDTPELRLFIARVIELALADLEITEKQYRPQLLKSGDSVPAFFADFRRQYSNLRIDIKAPAVSASNSFNPSGHLLYVQQKLNKRPPVKNSGNLSGSSPPIVVAARQVINDNAAAYNIVISTGRARFSAQFSSFPRGASIYYRQAILPDFKMWPAPTDVSSADFDLATTIFKFHKDGCVDEPVRTIDPYDDTHPIISVEFKRCAKQ